MLKKLHLKALLLMATLVFGVGSAWATAYKSILNGVQQASTTITTSNVSNGTVGVISWTGTDCSYSSKRVNISAGGSITFTASTGYVITKIVIISGSSAEYYGTWTSSPSVTPTSSDGTTTLDGFNSKSVTVTTSTAFRCTSASSISIHYEEVAHTLTYSATNGSITGVDAKSNAVFSGGSVAEGATVTLSATPSEGFSFTGWSVSGTGSTLSSTSTSTTTFTMGTADATVTAIFTPLEIVSDIILNSVTNGRIEADKRKANVGETVTLTAHPDDGYALAEWTVLGDDYLEVTKTGENTATFVMPATEVHVGATFATKHTVTYFVAGESNTVSRAHGTTLSLDDQDDVAGMPFAGWSSTNTATAPDRKSVV